MTARQEKPFDAGLAGGYNQFGRLTGCSFLVEREEWLSCGNIEQDQEPGADLRQRLRR